MMSLTKGGMFLQLLLITLFCCSQHIALAANPDQHENCEFWANTGECEKNSGYMMENCATSCERVALKKFNDEEALAKIGSFFDLSAKDIKGNMIDFKSFEGDVTIIVNVASYCGYTDSHYKGVSIDSPPQGDRSLFFRHLTESANFLSRFFVQMVSMWKYLSLTEQVHLLAFPCNQFGGQEPDSNKEIQDFVTSNYGVQFTMMDKVDVNGPNASMVFKYLKSKANIGNIAWNFATYFVVDKVGEVTAHSGLNDNEDFMELRKAVLRLADWQEL